MSGDASMVEGPLAGYHHETYVLRLPDGTDTRRVVRWKCREPRSQLLWFDRRCFPSEEQLLRALEGRITGIPEIIPAGSMNLQRFIEGETLGARHGSGTAVPESILGQIIAFFRQMARVGMDELSLERSCEPRDRPADGDTDGFLERLICFTEERIYQKYVKGFENLYESLGLHDDLFKNLRKHLAGLTPRPFCLLHADLHRENFILDPQNRLWLIDWELAIVGDPLYDLATHLHLMRYPEPQERATVARWRMAVEEVRPGGSAGGSAEAARLQTGTCRLHGRHPSVPVAGRRSGGGYGTLFPCGGRKVARGRRRSCASTRTGYSAERAGDPFVTRRMVFELRDRRFRARAGVRLGETWEKIFSRRPPKTLQGQAIQRP